MQEVRDSTLNLSVRLRPVAFVVLLLAAWQIAVARHPGSLIPGPWSVARGIGELLQHGLLLKYVVASLFRVTWGFLLAASPPFRLVCLSAGIAGQNWPSTRLAQILRPISPLAWIPLAILWFGVGDLAAIFLIFVGCFLSSAPHHH